MLQITLKVDGMMCGMCEAHVNDAVRATCNVKKVSSSHTKGETVILTEQDIPDDTLKGLIEKTGYQLTGIQRASYEKKGFFAKFKK